MVILTIKMTSEQKLTVVFNEHDEYAESEYWKML